MGIRVLCVAGAIGSLVLTVALAPGCGGSNNQGTGFGSGSGSSGSGSGGSNGSSGGSNSSSSSGVVGFGDASGGDGSFVCTPNPANYDIPGNNCDDDGDGKVDNTPTCDGSLMLTGTAHDFANAMGLCQDVSGQKWGIVSATYTKGFGGGGAPNDGQHGILPHFGTSIMPREGSMLGVLSSGYAREWDNSGGTGSGACPAPMNPTTLGAPCFKGYQTPMDGMIPGQAPPGYPKAAANCPSQMGAGIFDTISLTLQVKTPANAQGLQFDFDFYSGEWPEYVCTNFNDSFVAWLQSGAFMGKNGDLNISYDSKGNPVSVNNAFFETCTSNAPTGCCSGMQGCGTATGTAACTNGPGALAGTGFEDDGTFCVSPSTGGGATGWLTTTAPVKPGEVITIQFIIWDTGDNNWDSSVLVDHFTWQPGQTMTGTQPAQ